MNERHFQIENNTLLRYTGEESDVVIPAGITSIAPLAFINKENITSVLMQENVAEIGHHAFMGCLNLTEIALPTSVRIIDDYAFYGCEKLEKVRVDERCSRRFGKNVFGETPFVKQNDGLIILGDCVLGISTQEEVVEELIIPEGVRFVADFAFRGMYDSPKIQKVIFPESLVVIGEGAFEYQDQLTEVHFGGNLRLIRDRAFYKCNQLANVHLNRKDLNRNYVNVIRDAFVYTEWEDLDKECKTGFVYIKEEKAHNDETAESKIVSDEYWIEDGIAFCKGKTLAGDPYVSLIRYPAGRCIDFQIPEGVDHFETDAFDKTEISGIVFPNTMRFIPDGAFYNCNNLERVVLPASIKGIGDQGWENPFESCKNLISVDVDLHNKHFFSVDGLLYNATGRLLCCPAGKTGKIKVPHFCREIGEHAFANSQASAITLPDNLQIIASGAFINCQQLTSISIPESVIGTYGKLFCGCTSLKDVYLHTSECVLKSEHEAQFTGCPKDLRIHGKAGGDIERYAKDNGFCFCKLTD